MSYANYYGPFYDPLLPALANQIGFSFKLTNAFAVNTAMVDDTDTLVVNMVNFPAGRWLISGSIGLAPDVTTTIQFVNSSCTGSSLSVVSGGNYAVNTTLYPLIVGHFISTGATTLNVVYRVNFAVAGINILGGQGASNTLYATRIA